MPAFVRSESLRGHHDVAAALSLEFWIGTFQEQEQFLHHVSDIVGIYERETQFHRAPSDRYVWILQAFLKYAEKILIAMNIFICLKKKISK